MEACLKLLYFLLQEIILINGLTCTAIHLKINLKCYYSTWPFSLSFKSTKALIYTPTTNLLPWIISSIVQFLTSKAHQTGRRSYGLQPLLTAQLTRRKSIEEDCHINLLVTETFISMGWPVGMSFVLQMCNLATDGQDNIQHCNHYVIAVTFQKF